MSFKTSAKFLHRHFACIAITLAAIAGIMPALTCGAFPTLNGDLNSSSPTYSGTAVAPDSGVFWNSLSANTPSGPMLLSDGFTPTPITFFVGAYGPADNGTSLTTPAGDLMRDYAFNFSTVVNPVFDYIFSNVPVGRYDLYLYAQNGNSKNSISEFTVGTTVHTAANGGAGTTTFILNDNYVLFDNLTPSGGVISGSWRDLGASGASFNGFQLVAVPEPTSVGLLALGGLLLWRKVRRA